MSSWEIKGILEGSADGMWAGQLYWLRDFQAGDPLTLSFLVCVRQASSLYKAVPAREISSHYSTAFSRMFGDCVYLCESGLKEPQNVLPLDGIWFRSLSD